MEHLSLILGGSVIWLAIAIFAAALCRASKDADQSAMIAFEKWKREREDEHES